MIQQPGQGRRSQKVRGKKKRKKKTFLVKSEDGLCEFRSFIIQAAETIEKTNAEITERLFLTAPQMFVLSSSLEENASAMLTSLSWLQIISIKGKFRSF